MKRRDWLRSSQRNNRKLGRRLTMGEMLEPRLALTWAAVPSPSIPAPPPGVTNLVLNSNSDASYNDKIENNEIDYYQFQATSTGPYVISAKTPNSSLDTVLGVFSSTGKRLTFNDNISSTNKDSQVAFNLIDGATYFVGITNRVADKSGTYTLRIDGLWATPPDDSFEENDSKAIAKDLGIVKAPKTIKNLGLRDAADWYKFTTINTGNFNHSVSIDFQHDRGDLELELHNGSKLIARSNGVGNRETISLNGLAAGAYFVRVVGFKSAFNPNYSLTINPPTTPPPPETRELVGYSLKVTDDTNWDEIISVQAKVSNLGTVATGDFNVQWYLSEDSKGSADDILLERTQGLGNSYLVKGIAPGGTSFSINANLQLPEVIPADWEGTLFYLIMKTDVNNEVVGEVSELNNFGQAGPSRDRVPLAFGRKTTADGGFNIDLQMTVLTPTQRTIMKAAAHRWEQVIVEDVPNAVLNGQVIDDIVITVSSQLIDGPGTVLGQGGPSAVREDTEIPALSALQFDAADVFGMEEDESLYEVALHEIGHALGLFFIRSDDFIEEDMDGNPIFTGANALAAYCEIFGLDPEMTEGVPMDDIGAHWNEDVFGDELMTPEIAPGDLAPISAVTAGALIDYGYNIDPMQLNPYLTAALTSSLFAASYVTSSHGPYALTAASPPQPLQAINASSVPSPAAGIAVGQFLVVGLGINTPDRSENAVGFKLTNLPEPTQETRVSKNAAAVDWLMAASPTANDYHHDHDNPNDAYELSTLESGLGVSWSL